MEFNPESNLKMSPDDIAKKVNRKITVFGLSPEEWTWAIMQTFIFFVTATFFSIVLINLGRNINPLMEDVGMLISTGSIILFIPVLYLSIKILKRITKRFGENTAFLVLSQHSAISLLISKKVGVKNYKFKPIPNNGYKRIE